MTTLRILAMLHTDLLLNLIPIIAHKSVCLPTAKHTILLNTELNKKQEATLRRGKRGKTLPQI